MSGSLGIYYTPGKIMPEGKECSLLSPDVVADQSLQGELSHAVRTGKLSDL
jgi:hypothetical protein